MSDIPAAALKVINARAAGGKIVSTKKVAEDGKTEFAVVIEKAGKQQEITVTPEGKVGDTESIKH